MVEIQEMICALVSTLEHFLNSLIFVIFEGIENILLSSLYKFRSCENIGDNTIKIVLMSFWTMISILIQSIVLLKLQVKYTLKINHPN